MSEDLTDLLHRHAEDIPVLVRSPQELRRGVERAHARRQRAGVVAVAVVTALIVGAGAVLRGAAGGADSPPANESPSPTDSSVGTQIDRGLLRPPDLPSTTPFGEWAGREPVPLGSTPFCSRWLVDFVSATAARFRSSETGVEGYQAVLEFRSPAAASVLDDDPAAALSACGRLPGTGYDNWGGDEGTSAILPHPGRRGRGGSVLVVSHQGRFLSLLWLASPNTAKIPDPDVQRLLASTYTQLYEGTDNRILDVPVGALERSLLRADALPFGPGEHPQPRDQAVNLHGTRGWLVCDAAVAPELAVTRDALFVAEGTPYAELGGQRIYIASSPDAAHQLIGQLADRMRACPSATDPPWGVTPRRDFSTPDLADEAVGITYRYEFTAKPLAGKSDVIYVVLVRTGSVVTQVWRRERVGPSDPGAAAVGDLASAAVDRIRSVLPASVTGTNG